jgi:hypothetical protein
MSVQLETNARASARNRRARKQPTTIVESRIDAFGRGDFSVRAKSRLFQIEVEGEMGAELDFVLRGHDGRAIAPHDDDGERKTYLLSDAIDPLILSVTNFGASADWVKARIEHI